jgi:outer membrane protein, heavy metal efflux system
VILALWLISSAWSTTLESVLTMAGERMPLILEAQEKARAAGGQLESAEGAFDHKIKVKTLNQFESKYDNQLWDARLERQTPFSGVSYFVGQRQGTGTYATYEGKYQTSSIGELFAGVDIPLLRDRAMDLPRLQRERARQESQQAKIDLKQKTLEVFLKTGATYWKWIVSGQKLRIVKTWTEIAIQRQEMLEKKVAAGDTSAIKLVDNRRSLSKRRAELVKASREFELACQELALYTGAASYALSDVPSAFELSTDKTNTPPATTALLLPPFQLLQAQRQLLAQEKNYAEALRLPELRLGLEGARDLGVLPPNQNDPDQLRASLRIEIPIENRKGAGKVSEVRGKLAALAKREEWLQREWQNRLQQNRVSLETTRSQLELQEQEVADAERMAKAEMKRLQQGDSDVFFVNVREQDEADARIRLLETKSLHEIMVLERRSLDGELLQLLSSYLPKEFQ